MGALRFGLRTFFVGLAVGLLVAPRPGAESRRMLREHCVQFMDSIAELLALPQAPVDAPTRPKRPESSGS